MNSYFESLLKPERKRKVVVVGFNTFYLFSGRFESFIRYDLFVIRTGRYQLDFRWNYRHWQFDTDYSDENGYHSNSFSSHNKHELNLEIQEYNFKGKNIFLRMEERMVDSLFLH
jgi:hypothetical protein